MLRLMMLRGRYSILIHLLLLLHWILGHLLLWNRILADLLLLLLLWGRLVLVLLLRYRVLHGI